MALPVTLDDHVVQYINQTYNFDSDNQKLQLTSSGYYIQPILNNSYLPIHKWKGRRSPPKLPYNHSVYRSILQFKWHYETFTMGDRPEDSKEHTSVVDLCPLPNHITHLCCHTCLSNSLCSRDDNVQVWLLYDRSYLRGFITRAVSYNSCSFGIMLNHY